MSSPNRIEQICTERGLRMTEQRRVIASVVSSSDDHPDVDTVYRRSNDIDSKISIATVYRTLRLFEDAGILQRHDFGDGRARYEDVLDREHHDHLIDVESGEVIEFHDEQLEALKAKVAERHGYELVDHRLELYAKPKKTSA